MIKLLLVALVALPLAGCFGSSAPPPVVVIPPGPVVTPPGPGPSVGAAYYSGQGDYRYDRRWRRNW